MLVIDICRTIIYFILLFFCAYTDYKKGKIYNKALTYFLIAFALIYIIAYIVFRIIDVDQISLLNDNLKNNALGFIICFAIGFIFYALGIFKGGDGKLFAIVGLCSGAASVTTHFVIIFLVAGVSALYVLIKNKILLSKLKRLWLYLKGIILTFKFTRYEIEPGDKIKFPFAVYICLGEIISYLYIYLRS